MPFTREDALPVDRHLPAHQPGIAREAGAGTHFNALARRKQDIDPSGSMRGSRRGARPTSPLNRRLPDRPLEREVAGPEAGIGKCSLSFGHLAESLPGRFGTSTLPGFPGVT
jgi:hypothetical protein